MQSLSESSAAAERFHFLDVVRATLMVLGIPFHAASVFTSWSWIVAWPEHSASLALVAPVLTSFRMPAFFLIAGFFGALLLERRSPAHWLRMRAVRLGVPLVTGILLIVPAQDLLLALGPWGVTHLPRTLGGIFLSHLWFLPVLLMLCTALAVSWRWVSRIPFPDLPAWLLGLAIGIWTLGLRGLVSLLGIELAPFDRLLEIDSVAEYAPYFLLGVAMRRNRAIFERFGSWNWPTALIGVLALACTVLNSEMASNTQLVAWLLSGPIAAVCTTQSLLALAAQIADRPIPLIETLVDASFSIYLFHQPVIVILSLLLLDAGLGPVSSWFAICVATLIITYALHRGLRRSRVLLFLFNGKWPANAPRPSSARCQSPRPAEHPA